MVVVFNLPFLYLLRLAVVHFSCKKKILGYGGCMFYRKKLVVDSRNYQFWYVNIKIQASSFELKIPFMLMRWLKSEMNFIIRQGSCIC